MYARVVRFTDVDADRIADLVARINSGDGPPEGVPASGVQVLHDADQGTAVVVQLYSSQEDMATGEAVFDQMDSSDTPGTRGTVDRCELKAEMKL